MSYEPLRLYTGKLGHGKTLKAVFDLCEQIKAEENKSVEQKRHFYTNIDGLKIEGVLQAPDDWRKVPKGSLIIYDEADSIEYYQAGSNKIIPDVLREIKFARKRDIHIWFIVQHPNQLNVFIRRIIGEHIHMRRPLGAELSKAYYFADVCDDPTDPLQQKKAEKTALFHFPKHLYDIYDSANTGSNHRQKMYIPERYIQGIIFFLLLMIGPALYFTFNDGFFKINKETKEVQTEQVDDDLSMFTVVHDAITPTIPIQHNVDAQNSSIQDFSNQSLPKDTNQSLPKDPLLNSQNPIIGGVIMMGDKCLAYDHDGQLLDVSLQDCVNAVKSAGIVHKKLQESG